MMDLSAGRNRNTAHFAELTAGTIGMTTGFAGDLTHGVACSLAGMAAYGRFRGKALHDLHRVGDRFLAGERAAHIGLEPIEKLIHVRIVGELFLRAGVR